MKTTAALGFGILVSLLMLTCFSTPASAAELDLEFADNGVAITDFGAGNDEAYDLAVQPDGKIVVVGYSFNGAVKNIAVARYLPDGTLDPDFNHEGFATFSLGAEDSVARAVELQEDGKIVVVGSTVDGDSDIAILRLTEEGLLDSPFGFGGHLLITMPGSESGIGVEIGADGSLYVAGSSLQEDDTSSAVVAKLDPAGVLEETFGDGGVVTIEKDYNLTANDLLLLDGGSIMIVSSADHGTALAPELFRLNDDGSLDQTFGAGGEVSLTFVDKDAELYDVISLSGGGFAAVGYLHNGSYREPLVARLLENGEVDGSFGESGVLYSDLGNDAVAYGVASREDGSLAVTGYSLTSTGKDLILLQTSATAEPVSSEQQPAPAESGDAALPEEGDGAAETASYVVTDVDRYDDESRAVTMLPDGTVLTAGYAGNGTDSDFVLAQYRSEATGDEARQAGTSAGEVTGNFYLQTLQPTSITRNSAATGGSISERVSAKNCEWYCETVCEESEDEACYDTCYEECLPETITVVSRGVVYSIVQYPVYGSDDSDSEDSGDEEVAASSAGGSFLDTDSSHNYELVRSGQTSDGSGIGIYGSDIFDITPNTLYYVRAYAVLSDETVIYGNQVTFKTHDACFIATAAFGSLIDEHVVVLRQFRDRFMKSSEFGKSLIALYYAYSPPVADFIRDNDLLRTVVRIVLIPVIGLCYLLLHSYLPVLVGLLLISAVFIVPVMLLPREIRYENYESESNEKRSVEKPAER